MRPLHWLGLAQLVLALCVPFPQLAILALPCWVVLYVQTRTLTPLDSRFALASRFAAAGVGFYILLFALGVARLVSAPMLYIATIAGLVVTSGFLFCSATGVYVRAEGAGDTRAAKACNFVRWTVLCMTVVGVLTLVAALIGVSAGSTGWGASEQLLLQVSSLGVLVATLTFVYVVIRSANEPWTELPGGVRHGP